MKIGIKDFFTHEGIGVLFLMIPILSKWLLPPGIESKFYIQPFNLFNIYIPNILLLFTPCFFKHARFSNTWNRVLFWTWLIWEVIVVSFSDTPNAFMNICSNTFFFGALYLGLFHKLTPFQIILLKPLCILGSIIISFQLILLATGIWAYDLGDIGGDFSGIIRVYTTAGETNASGTIISLVLFFLLLTIKENNWEKLIIIIVSVISILFTVSRGPILLTIMAFVYIWLKYYRKKTKYNLAFFSIIALLAYLGVFNPIIDRTARKDADGDITSGRNILIETVLNDVNRNNAEILGLGIGNVYQTTEVAYSKVEMPHPGAPHNFYVLLYAEQGIIGIILFLLLLVPYLAKNYRHNKDACVFLILLLLTVYNTETTFAVNSNYVYLVALLMMLINADKQYKVVTA